jgi:hypothetical protein
MIRLERETLVSGSRVGIAVVVVVGDANVITVVVVTTVVLIVGICGIWGWP